MSPDGSSPVQSYSAGAQNAADAGQVASKDAHPAKKNPVKPGILAAPANKHTRLDHKAQKSPTSPDGRLKGPRLAGTVTARKLADEGAASILLPDTKREADTTQSPHPFAAGRSDKHPQSGGSPGRTSEASRQPRQVAAVHGTSSESAKSAEVSFDPGTGNLKTGTLEDYLNQQLREYGGVFIADTTRSGGNVGQIQDMCKNLANWISHAEGVPILYTDIIDDPVLLTRLMTREAPKDGQPDPDLDKLVDKVILKDPTVSRSGAYVDTRSLIEHKMRAYVGMLRTVKHNGIDIRVLNGKIEKNKPHIIVGSFTKAHGARLPIFEPYVEDDPVLMNKGSVTKIKRENRVIFDPAVLSHQTTKVRSEIATDPASRPHARR